MKLHVFTLKHGGQKHRVGLTELSPAKPDLALLNPTLRIACKAYRPQGENGSLADHGHGLQGEVPVKEFVRWARTKGYLTWKSNGGNGHAPVAKPGSVAKLQAAPGGRGQR